MAENIKFKMTHKSLISILICTAGIFLFFFGVLFPQRQTLAKLDQEIMVLNPQIEEQKVLFPFYQALKQQLDARCASESPRKSDAFSSWARIFTYCMLIIDGYVIQ